MMTSVAVSVVISTFNRAHLLAGALDALLAQELSGRYEVIVVDNNSTDGTAELVLPLLNRTSNLSYVFEPRQGLPNARNAGIRAARGAIIAFTDDDVRVGPDWCATILRAFEAYPEADVIGGRVVPTWPDDVPAWVTRRQLGPFALGERGGAPIRVGKDNASLCLVGANFAFRRTAFERVGLFDPAYTKSQDREIQLRLWRAGGIGMYVPELAIAVEIPPDRLTRPYFRQWYATYGRYHSRMRLLDTIDHDGRLVDRPGRQLLGVPAFLYRELAVSVRGWLTNAARLDTATSFYWENRSRYLYSYIRERHRAPAAPPPPRVPSLVRGHDPHSAGSLMNTPVVALGLDAADPVLLERYMDAGHLPVLSGLRARGAYARLTTFDYCRAEASNTTFLTGCSPAKHGYWSPFRFRTDYRVETTPYEFADYQPFYGLGSQYRVAVFDMPQSKLSNKVNGVQVLGWGAHSPRSPSHSDPPELFADIVARHGEHPTLRKDDVHSMGDAAAMRRLQEGLATGIERRTAACIDLLTREPWDLFLTYFSEIHAGQHYFWHLSHPDHPLFQYFGTPGKDPLLELVQAVDRSIGRILEAMPAHARVVVFSDHGMESNTTDIPSTVFLPELLYRLAYPGQFGLARGVAGTPPPPVARPSADRSWRSTLYGLKYDANPVTRWLRQHMATDTFHYGIEKRLGMNSVPLCPDDCPLGAQPPMWYHPAWPGMRAFALPSFSEGFVRLNVRGREASGIVDPADYDRTCDEIAAELQRLTDARTGKPAVKRVVRTRVGPDGPAIDGERPSDADLIVIWDGVPIDVVDHPTAGRIGPVPFKRSGSHVHRGFLMAAGPGVPEGARLPEGHALDIPPTILTLLGANIPAHFDGTALAVTSAVDAVRRAG